jgi:hypothetical protein
MNASPTNRKVGSLNGQRFGRLTVIATYSHPYKDSFDTLCDCVCDCGKSLTVRRKSLRSGTTASCGCLRSATSRVLEWERLSNEEQVTRLRLALPDAMQPLIGAGGVKFVPLTQGQFTSVDEADYDAVRLLRWHAARHKKIFYASRSAPNSRGVRQGLHSLLMNPGKGMMVDHKNGCGLDNRRSNLRIADWFGNSRNRAPFGKASKFKGVSFDKIRRKWLARICANGTRTILGFFAVEEDAAAAYEKAEKQLFGEFATSNRAAA